MKSCQSIRLVVAALLLTLAWTGCGPAPPAPKPDAAPDATAADWCGEHGVPESLCTRCNPKLIPEFQARGDWCSEHGLPESQCTLCHPELIEKFRRMAPETTPYAGLRVRLASPETASKAGIEVEEVKEELVNLPVEAPVRLTFDETRAARIASPMTGIVRELRVTAGTRVKAGAPVVVVASPEIAEAAARLRDAEAALALARQDVDRQATLFAQKIAPRRELEEAERRREAAEAALGSARGALTSFGVSASDPLDPTGRLVLSAPRGGVVTAVHTAVGQAVTTDLVLVEIEEPGHLWAEVDLPESDAARVHEGDDVILAFDALPDRTVTGTIRWISPTVDPQTRMVRARAGIANPDGALRAGMYGRARLRHARHRSVVVPESAVQDGPEGPLSFVRIHPQLYEPRPLRLGPARARGVEVVAGLRPGDMVVTTGAFLLKTEIMKGSLGAGCCEPGKK